MADPEGVDAHCHDLLNVYCIQLDGGQVHDPFGLVGGVGDLRLHVVAFRVLCCPGADFVGLGTFGVYHILVVGVAGLRGSEVSKLPNREFPNNDHSGLAVGG